MAITCTNLGNGYLLGNTNVTPGAGTAKRTLVMITMQTTTTGAAITSSLATPTDTQSNKWSTLLTGASGSSSFLGVYASPQERAIVPGSGDSIALPGDATHPVFWSLYELTESEPDKAESNTAVLNTFTTSVSTASTTPSRRGGMLIAGWICSGDTAANGSGFTGWSGPFWNTGGTNITAVDNPTNTEWGHFGTGYRLASAGTSFTYSGGWSTTFSGPWAGLCGFVQLAPWRTGQEQLPKVIRQGVVRAGFR